MTKRYEIANLSSAVVTYEGQLVQPRTRRVLELDEPFTDAKLARLHSRGVLVQETTKDAENGRPLPPAEPALVEAYTRLATAEGADREKLLADLGFGKGKAVLPAKKAD